MNRKVVVTIIALLVIGVAFVATYFSLQSSHSSVIFEDSKLEAIIREKIGMPNGTILKSHLDAITELDLTYKDIASIRGIENLSNLRFLNLENNFIKDVSPLESLKKLEYLNLRNNEITNLKSIKLDKLEHLPQLRYLSLRHNVVRIETDGNTVQKRISDISILGGFTQLEELDLRDNFISDISPLSTLINLKFLDISQNAILTKNINTLESLTKLEELNLRECELDDIAVVENFSNLKYLNLHSNYNLASIKPVESLVKLETLILKNVNIGDDIVFLENLVNLTRLNIQNTSITDLTIIGELMGKGALQNSFAANLNADVDLADNPIPTLSYDGIDGYAPIRDFWQNITLRSPYYLPPPTQQLFINEFMSSNGSTIFDTDGDYSDWIELYNPTEYDINIGKYYLSDDESHIKKWRFAENTIIPANGFILVWASGKDKTTVNGELHTNFSLDRTGEPIIFSDDAGNVLDFVSAIFVPRDFSYGRKPDGGKEWYLFESKNCTPRESNNAAITTT